MVFDILANSVFPAAYLIVFRIIIINKSKSAKKKLHIPNITEKNYINYIKYITMHQWAIYIIL